ncbi:hypothetical protein NIES208_10390 [[Limnothrix rosea] IAM M-220]|nr:hypothetical protein NIES208_10390 [[Limnothrix rosea] IAM M-220]
MNRSSKELWFLSSTLESIQSVFKALKDWWMQVLFKARFVQDLKTRLLPVSENDCKRFGFDIL